MPIPKITTEIVNVTPAVAEKMLGKNVRNRRVKTRNVEAFARDMEAGRWLMTGEAIKVDTRGNLLDGQNRLHAVIISGSTVPLLVVKGLQAESQDVMDSGSPRSNGDMFAMHGYTNSNIVASTANAYHGWTTGQFPHAMVQSTPKLTHSEAKALIAEHPELAEAAAFASTLRSVMNLPQSSIAVAQVLFARIDADDCTEFFNRCKDLRTAGKGDPVNTLIKRTTELRANRQRVWVSTALFMLFRSWNACRMGEHFEKFQFGSSLRGWVAIPEPK